MGHKRPQGVRDASDRKPRSDRSRHPDHSGFCDSQQRQTGSVQTNLFGGNPDDLAAGFRRHMRQLAAELRAETGEERRISGDGDDPVTNDPVEEAAED